MIFLVNLTPPTYVDSADITVTVDRGVATLEGTVETRAEYLAARENAFKGGAVWVVNELSITGVGGDT